MGSLRKLYLDLVRPSTPTAMADIDWTRFQKSIFIKASPQRVFDAWMTPGLITTWFLEKAEYTTSDGAKLSDNDRVSEGDSYAWQWWNSPVTEKGRVLKVDE